MNKEMSSLELKVDALRSQLQDIHENLKNNMFDDTLITTEKDVILQIQKWDAIHEQVLRQKSRATWIAHGDSNSKYFHAHLRARPSINRVASICNEQGLLETAAAELPYIDPTIARDGPCLNPEQQRQMTVPITREEILTTLHSLPCDKSPGTDGFRVEFFREN
ncbi:uncharacterized protein LOC132630339 [Lycium barbarum]|uniref:uncharacterized protein LOC132630339 n=1 Tax=Lycium barbarum TaxID=112863 RepID=UPI00293EE19C|nr:uncharacterized protein LOC132630339 [Lycium barbarum]